MTSALTPFKRVDIPVRVLSALGIPLKIIGAGDQRADLECLAWPTIQFLGRLSDSEVFEVYAWARGFLMPQKEDAGMAPLEAMAAGLPVFGQAAGGLLETNSDGVTWRFFATEDDASFREAFIAFDAEVSWGRYDDSSVFERHVAQYDVSVFRERFQSYVPWAMTSDSETE